MSLAFDLADKSDDVLRIEGPAGDVSSELITKARKSGEKPYRARLAPIKKARIT